MNNWSNENFAMQHAMGVPMNMMPNMPPLMQPNVPPLMPPMCMVPNQDVPPLNPPPMPMQLLAQTPDSTNQENEKAQPEEKNDVNSESRKRSRDRSNNSRRDRDRGSGRRSRSKERDYSRQDRADKQDKSRRDKNFGGGQRDRRTKWNDKDKEETPRMTGPLLPTPGLPGGMNMQGNMMMHSGMGGYHNMQHSGMMQPAMMQQNLMMQHQMDQPSLMSQMNMMNSMMPNMMDQNMLMMNQQAMMGNQPLYISSGVILPPIAGFQTPQLREKPRGCHTVFVGGLPNGVTVDALNEIFHRCGSIEEVKPNQNGGFYVCFESPESVDHALSLTGYRFKFHDQMDSEATTIFIDYALNREDQNKYERAQRQRERTPVRTVPFSAAALSDLTEKIKVEEEFINVAPTLASWLERGDCNKKNANAFYSLVQMSNNQIRRLFNEKMQLDDEYQTMKNTFREKFAHVLKQFELVAKILSAAKHQRISDHFTKQQRRNIDMWLKMTEEVENIREEFQTMFDEDDTEKMGKNVVPLEKYEELKMENENLSYELEGYKNEAHLAKDEAERKFEKFKAHFVAQQALQNKSQVFPPLPMPPSPKPPPPLPKNEASAPVPPSEAKLISILTAFLMVHPLGASIDYLTSYVKSLTPNVAQADVQSILTKYGEVFQCKTTGVGASIEQRWTYAAFDVIKSEAKLFQ